MSAETSQPADQPTMPPDCMFATPSAKQAWLTFQKETATYRRELPRLVQEGETGRFAFIKGDQILSIWDTFGDAVQAAREKFGLEPVYIAKIDLRDEERWSLWEKRVKAGCQR